MSEKNNLPKRDASDREVVSTRIFHAPREHVWRAWAEPARLAQWWGPKGFTNTFQEFDLRPGGAWRFIMHGPDGQDYPNDKRFLEVVPFERVVFQHAQPAHNFKMTMTLADEAGGTRVTWHLLFESAAECAPVRNFIVEANEQNFDRLENHLTTMI